MAERYLRSIRLLAECYQAFERHSQDNLRRRTGLTSAQFDIIATLGNTTGLTFKELGEKTLITKGTLTGVVDRLESRGLVVRIAQIEDRRSTIVRLTDAGEQEFGRVFSPQIKHCKLPFENYSEKDFDALEAALGKLHAQLSSPTKNTRR
ncbi:MarR family transcriptional regulator [uncultured Oxalicibacterium sp.]|uniref:MarR family winged helix-turn-helix transcriptional regulator n=1 Tax=uncultured Oxalicibacterium sp. TaxID=1168540 RepID=UPI0025F91EE8|nr:MarR family transcriptional regulator [uncultured Oxalicibacterium sp.]